MSEAQHDEPPRLDRRQQQRVAGRAAILDAAEDVFAEHGFHDASLREIAELAHYSVGAVYTFFADKDALYREVFHRRGAEFLTGMRDLLAADRTAREQLHDLADWQFGFFTRHRRFGRLVLRGGAIASPVVEPEADPEVASNFRAAHELQEALVARGQRSGEFRSGSPDVLARMFSGIVSSAQAAQLESPSGRSRPGVARLMHDVLDAAFARPS